MKDQQQSGFGSKMGHMADVVVGDAILGSIGRIGFHVGKIPGVAKAGAYVRDNVRDGYSAAELAEKKRKCIAALRKIAKEGVALSPDVLMQIAQDNGLKPEHLKDISEMAKKAAGKAMGKSEDVPMPGDGTYSAPAAAGA